MNSLQQFANDLANAPVHLRLVYYDSRTFCGVNDDTRHDGPKSIEQVTCRKCLTTARAIGQAAAERLRELAALPVLDELKAIRGVLTEISAGAGRATKTP